MANKVHGIEVKAMHDTGRPRQQKHWRFEYNGEVFHIREVSRKRKSVKDSEGNDVTSFADNLEEAVEEAMAARPHGAALELTNEAERALKSGDIETLRAAREKVANDNDVLMWRARMRFLNRFDDEIGTLERRQQYVDQQNSVRGKYMLRVLVKLTDQGTWSETTAVHKMVDDIGSSYIVLRNDSERTIEELDAQLRARGLMALNEFYKLTPVAQRKVEDFDPDEGLGHIGKEEVTGKMVAGYKDRGLFDRPVRQAGGGELLATEPSDRHIELRVNQAKQEVRKSITDEFNRLKSMMFDLQSADQ